MNELSHSQPVLPPDTEAIWNDCNIILGRFIRQHVHDAVEAEDILQDVFLKIQMNVSELRDHGRLVSWIYQITRNAIADYYRSQHTFTELPETLVASDDDEEDDLTQRLACSLRGMVDSLPNKYRDALLMTEYQGLTQQEFAARFDISLSGAKSRVQRARDLLKSQLLMCCHFELDRRGRVIDYYPHRACPASCEC